MQKKKKIIILNYISKKITLKKSLLLNYSQ
jgi:hypothetical protein